MLYMPSICQPLGFIKLVKTQKINLKKDDTGCISNPNDGVAANNCIYYLQFSPIQHPCMYPCYQKLFASEICFGKLMQHMLKCF